MDIINEDVHYSCMDIIAGLGEEGFTNVQKSCNKSKSFIMEVLLGLKEDEHVLNTAKYVFITKKLGVLNKHAIELSKKL